LTLENNQLDGKYLYFHGFIYKSDGMCDERSQFAKFYPGVKMFWLLLLVFAYLAYKWSVNSFDYFTKKGLPFEKPWPLVGNMLGLVTQTESLVYTMQRNYGKFKKSK
jgi:hypothetical protein